MPLTQEKRLDASFANNNDQSYLHKKFKKMASSISVFSPNSTKGGEGLHKESNVLHPACDTIITNGSIAAGHPEIERIKLKQEKQNADIEVEKNVQINYNDENSRLSNVNNNIQVSGQTSFTDEFSNKTDNLENDFIREPYNGGAGGRYICPYCKLSCAKPSVLQKHIRAHTNERPYPCVPCGFAFKTKSNLYKHRRSRTHALRLQGTDVSASLNDEDLSGGSESDTSMPPTPVSDTASDVYNRYENLRSNEISSPELTCDGVSQININLSAIENSKSKTIYKPKFRAAFYQDFDDKDKSKKTISPNADFLTEHISKIISDNEAIVDVIETPLQKKYGKIKQIAESKQFLNDSFDIKTDSIPLNLTKNNIEIENNFRKRSHSESFSQIDHQKHPLNPEGSIIKDLLLKTKANGLTPVTSDFVDGQGPLFVCPLCQIMYRSADNLEIHKNYYCKGLLNNTTLMSTTQKDIKVVRPENVFMRSNSVNVRLPETQQNSYSKTNAPNTSINPSKSKPDNLVIMKSEPSDIAAPLPSPGPLLGNTRLVDSKSSLDISRKNENVKLKPMASPKRRIENRSESYSPRLIENVSPRSADLYAQPKIRCIDVSASGLVSHHMRHNSASLQMFGGEVKIVDYSGSTTTLRIEPSKNQLSPILIQHNLSPSKLGSDTEGSSIVVRSGLHSGGTIMHNPPTPKDVIGTPQPQTSRMSLSNTPSISSSNLPNLHEVTHFQFPPLSAITAYNPLTLPPLSPSASPSGATTILHGGKLIPHVPGMPGPTNAGVLVGNQSTQPTIFLNNENIKNNPKKVREEVHSPVTSVDIQTSSIITGTSYDPKLSRRSPNLRAVHIESEKHQKGDNFTSDISQYIPTVPIIKVKNVDDPEGLCKTFSTGLIKSIIPKQDGVLKRSINGSPRTVVLKENTYYPVKNKSKDRINLNPMSKGNSLLHSDAEIRNFNFENLITKVEIYNNQIPSPSEVQKNTNAQDNSLSIQNERSETLYFQKTIASKSTPEEIKPKFLRPTTLPLKPGTFTPKRHHGITPTANTMSLVSPETPRPAKAYGQLYLNGNAYTYLGLKCSTKVFYCTINRPQPTYVPNQHFLSMYSNWQLLSDLTPDPLGLSASSAMSLYDSRHRPQNMTVSVMKQDLILTHSSQWKSSKDNNQTIMAVDPRNVEDKLNCENNLNAKRELTGGFESNEEYTYVRGRGRGRYVCSECGIRCKKPSMLKKHIRTHTDVRPYTCVHCAFSFKTKGNLTKHMKSKAHYKKCCELGINPNEGTDMEGGEMNQCSGETDDETDSEGDEGNEGETESSDTEVCKSRLPEHEAAHCLLSLGGSRPASSAAPGLLTSARPTTYPYTPTGLENANLELSPEKLMSRSSSIDSRLDAENEPMDLSKSDVKMSPNIPEIPTARESSVLASLASNTAKLPQHQSQWSNGEPMLHTYLTERALLDSKIKQSQLTCSLSKLRKIDLEKPVLVEKDCGKADDTIIVATKNCLSTCITSPKIIGVSKVKNENEDNSKITIVSKEEVIHVRDAPSPSLVLNVDNKRVNTPNNTNAENAKHVVSEYLKQARINLIKSQDEILNSQVSQDNSSDDGNSAKIGMEENTQGDELLMTETDPLKLPALEHDPIARKVVIGVGGVAFKVTKGKEFEGSSSFPTGRLMEDGRRVCDFCNKTFTKPSQLRLHLNIHYMERPFRCSVCAVSFRTRGHLQKHERSGSHHNKVSMTSTFGAATSFNPRPFRCSDCNIAFRIHGHLAKHLRSKMHVMRLECLFKLPFGTFTEIERAGVSLTDIDTTDCASSLASLQSLARKLHEKDPTKLEYREPTGSSTGAHPGRDSSEDDDAGLICDKTSDSEKDIDMKTIDSENIGKETRVNYSATDN